MINVLITYSTVTGNTLKIINKVYDKIKNEEINIDLIKVEEALKDSAIIDKYDVLIIGFWCRRSSLDFASKKLIEKIEGKKIFALGTMGHYPESEYGNSVLNNVKDVINQKNIYLGCFLSQGKINPERTEKRRNLPKDAPHYLNEEGYKRHLESRKHPNEEDFENACRAVMDAIKNLI